jgi:hypothetical protein
MVGSPYPGLSPGPAALLKVLSDRPVWSWAEVDAAARSLGLMAGGAIETINEWGFDRFDAPLIEDEDPITINLGLLVGMTAGISPGDDTPSP